MAGRKKSVSVQEELLLCPSAKPGDWFPGIPVSAVAGIDEAGRGCLAPLRTPLFIQSAI